MSVKYLTIGGVYGSPRWRVTWTEGDELKVHSGPLTRPQIEHLLKELIEALPNAPRE